MKKLRKWVPLVLMSLIVSLFSPSLVQAQVKSFENLFLEVTLDDSVIVLTSDTRTSDPLWQEVGITDVSAAKDEFSQMGVKAIFYDPATKTLAKLICKTSTDSRDLFNLNSVSSEQLNAFYDTMLQVNDESTSATIDDYPHAEVPFFRYCIQVNESTPLKESIYGTIINGSLFYYDVYVEGKSKTIDETFQQTLVAQTHFTKQYTKAEYDTLRRQSTIQLFVILFIVIALIVAVIFYSKYKKKKAAKRNELRLSALYQYYAKKKEQQAQGITEKMLYENKTTYSSQLIHQFSLFNTFIKKLHVWILTIVLYAFLLILVYSYSGFSLQLLVFVVVAIGIGYYQYYRMEKQCTFLWKPYENNKTKVAEFHFYETYFVMTGIQYPSEYPYLQITAVCTHKDYIYLYFGDEKAVYLLKDGFEGKDKEFLDYLNQKLSSETK